MKANRKGEIQLEKQYIFDIKNGNRQAFRKLYDLYFDYALRIATVICKNQASAGDIVQETFIRVYKNIDDFDMNKDFKPWFYRILINECYRYINKHGKVIPIEINEQVIQSMENVRHGFEEYEELYDAIQRLDDRNRIPIILKYLHDLNDKEIAQTLNVNINTVKSRIFKGKQKLKELLNNKGGGKCNDKS